MCRLEWLFENYQLWNRSPVDLFPLRFPLLSVSGTCENNPQLERFIYVCVCIGVLFKGKDNIETN